jgi:hypothetical protein
VGETAACANSENTGTAERLTVTLVALIERDRLSVAAAARALDLAVETAGALVRQWAVEIRRPIRRRRSA